MAETGPYFGNSMDLSLARQDSTEIPVGRITGVEVRLEATETEYFTADSVKRDAVAHTEKVPVVTGTIGSWDVLLAKSWLGGSGTASTGMVDTHDPPKFDVTGEVTPVGGSSKYEAVALGVTFPTLPVFSASMDEFVGLEIEGRGDDFDILTEPANP